MSLKVKLTSLITTFILLCSLLIVGVFAVKNTTFNVGGDIVFNVQGIEATITRGATAGFTADKTIGNAEGNILSDITLNNDMTAEQVAAEFAPWSGLNLAFSENVATIKLTITNTTSIEDNYLEINATAGAITKNNAEITVANDDGDDYIILKPQESSTFTIIFSVVDDEYSASLNGFFVNFQMNKYEIPSYDAVEDLEFSCNTTAKTATLTDGTSAVGDVVIPAYVQKDNIVCEVTSIGDDAFNCCYSLTSIIMPDSISSIGGNAFEDCPNLTTVKLGNGIIGIGREAFFYCENLTSITIPDSVVSLYTDDNAFFGCSSLTTITLPASVYISMGTFSGCSSLTTVNYRGTEEQWNVLVAFDGGGGEGIDDDNDELINAPTINFNYTGE